MNKLMFAALVAATAIGMTGCQTRITATKNAEQIVPIQEVVKVNGEDVVITKGCAVASGGWEATARSPLYATEALEGLEIGVETNGTVTMRLGKYARDMSTNAVAHTATLFSGGAQLVREIGETYAKIAGGGAQADTVVNTAVKAYEFFKSRGGDEAKAKVTASGDSMTISDGTTCVTCDKAGNCTSCADSATCSTCSGN